MNVYILCVLGCLIEYALTAVTPSIEVHISSSSVYEGNEVTVQCNMTNTKLGDFVSWKKKQGDQESTIGANHFLERNFVETGRYSILFESSENNMMFTLTINDTHVEDSGYIGCAAPGGEPVYQFLEVLVPVQEMQLYSMTSRSEMRNYSMGDVANFDLGDSVVFGCVANGSFPGATLSATISDKNVTSLFKKEAELMVLDDPIKSQGLVRMLHMTKIENRELPILMGREHKNAEFVCKASVPHFQPVEFKISINITFAPYINCTHVKAPRYANDVTLRCDVDSHPTVTHVHWSWVDSSGANKTLLPGQQMHVISSSGELEGQHSLHMSKVDEDLFGVYRITASNPLGETTTEVHLERDFAAESGSGAAMISLTLLVVSMFFTHF